MTTRNPWLGLASYDVPKGMEEDYLFCGRDEETMDIVRLIDNNLFVTLYGSSGIGKTSLLKAGVIPILKRKDYFPLYVRLSQESNEISYAEAIVRHLKNCGLTEESHVALEHADGNDRLFLWNYFATTRFLDADGREIYPVIILDQFEEVFRDGDKAKAELLLQQIYLLLNDELEIPDAEGYSADTNYRFVASIREDYLFVLEDSIDELSLDLYKNNRYRLRPMKSENACQVVLTPGRECIEESEKEKVAERVLELAKKPQSNDIDTLLLSLVCAGTFDKKVGEKITFGDLSIWKDNPMQIYYQDAMRVLNADQIRYIQQNLIREDGSRKRIGMEALKTALGENDFQELTKGKNRLFSIDDKGQVELLHDKLAMAVYEERKAFEERERKKKLRRRVSVVGALVLAIVGVFFFQNAKLKQQRWKMLESQSKLVADKAVSLAKEDSYLARILALEILPKDLSHPNDRPYTLEAEKALRMACDHASAIFGGTEDAGYYAVFSPDEKQIISRLNGNTLIVRNAESGAILSTKTIDSAYLAKYSPDGKRIVSASPNSLKMWDSETSALLWKIDAHNPHCITFSTDGNRIIFANDTVIKVVDATTSEELLSLFGYSDWINLLVVSPDGKKIVSSSYHTLVNVGYATYEDAADEEEMAVTENKIIIWDAITGKKLLSFPAHSNRINSISFSPDGKQFVTTSFDRDIKIWDVETGEEKKNMQWEMNSVSRDAVFTPDGNKVVSGHLSGLIKIWDVQTGEKIKEWEAHNSEIVSIAVSQDGQRIVSTSKDATMKIWNLESGVGDNVLAVIDSQISSAQISYDKENFVFISKGEVFLSVFNSKTGVKYNLNEYPYIYNHYTFSPDGKFFAASSAYDGDGTIIIWNTETGQIVQSFDRQARFISSLSFSPDSKQIISSSWDHTARVWDVETGEEIRQLQRVSNYYISAVYSPDMKTIAMVESGSTKAMLCDAITLDTIMVLDGHLSSISKLVFSLDGKTIASYDANATTKIWDGVTGECLQSIKGYFIAFSPDDRYCLLRKGQDMKTIDVFDIELGNSIYSITNQTDAICDASFSNDGYQIITVLSDGTIRKWPFPPLQELIDQTRERFKDRPLTDEERKIYYLE